MLPRPVKPDPFQPPLIQHTFYFALHPLDLGSRQGEQDRHLPLVLFPTSRSLVLSPLLLCGFLQQRHPTAVVEQEVLEDRRDHGEVREVSRETGGKGDGRGCVGKQGREGDERETGPEDDLSSVAVNAKRAW